MRLVISLGEDESPRRAKLRVHLVHSRRPLSQWDGSGGVAATVAWLMQIARIDEPRHVPTIADCEQTQRQARRHRDDHHWIVRQAGAKAGRFVGMDVVDPAIDFQALAASMGVPAERADDRHAIGAAVHRALRRDGPSLIEIPIR